MVVCRGAGMEGNADGGEIRVKLLLAGWASEAAGGGNAAGRGIPMEEAFSDGATGSGTCSANAFCRESNMRE